MSILKLKPACKDYLWGGHRLVDEDLTKENHCGTILKQRGWKCLEPIAADSGNSLF